MDHFERAGKGNGALPISAADAAEFQRQDRTDAFSARKQTVTHGVEQALLGKLLAELRLQKRFDGSAVPGDLVMKFTHLVHTPFLPACRRRSLSALRSPAPRCQAALRRTGRALFPPERASKTRPKVHFPVQAAGRWLTAAPLRLQTSWIFQTFLSSSCICSTCAVRLPLRRLTWMRWPVVTAPALVTSVPVSSVTML